MYYIPPIAPVAYLFGFVWFLTYVLCLEIGFKDSVSLLHAIFRRIGGNTKVLKKILLGNLCAVFRSVGSLFVELN